MQFNSLLEVLATGTTYSTGNSGSTILINRVYIVDESDI